MIKTIIFDFDGVIHNTFDFHMSRIERFSGEKLSKEEYKNAHDGNFHDSKTNTVLNKDWLLYAESVFHEMSNLKIDNKIFLELLKLKDVYSLFIISSGAEKNISGFLENNNALHLFKAVLGLEFHKSKQEKFKQILKKYNLKKNECVFVTDTLGDILEANKIGIKTIAVDFGFHDRQRLLKGKPLKIISNFNEILPTINNITHV